MKTETKLPAGVWRDDDEAEIFTCCDGNATSLPYNCVGTKCAACREYRVATEFEWQQVGDREEAYVATATEVLGYYCGLAGRP